MSTTLVPPSFYVVTPEGEAAREYRNVSEAAAAIVQRPRTQLTIAVVTGCRRRSLNERELHEFRRRIRACRLAAMEDRERLRSVPSLGSQPARARARRWRRH